MGGEGDGMGGTVGQELDFLGQGHTGVEVAYCFRRLCKQRSLTVAALGQMA